MFSLKALSRFTRTHKVWAAIVAAVVLVGGGTAVAVGMFAATPAPPVAAETPRPTPTAVAEPAPTPPDTVAVAATLASWNIAPGLESAVAVQAGRSSVDQTNVLLSVPHAGPILSQSFDVEPETTYSLRASFRGDGAEGSGIEILTGPTMATALERSTNAGEWKPTEWSYTTGADESTLTIKVQATGAVNGGSVDGITMVAASAPDTNLVLNGSFEEYSAPVQITNPTLIMQTGAAYLGLSSEAPAVPWTVRDETGADVLSGTAEGKLALISLGELPSGYYSASLAGSGLSRDAVGFLVLDELSAGEPDFRFGVGTRLENDAYERAARPASELGFASVRADVIWKNVEKLPGEYDFAARYDSAMAAYRDRGLDVLPLIAYGNQYYDDGRGPSSPAAIDAYAMYASEVVEHFAPDAAEIYNEFNHADHNNSACGQTPACYLQLLAPTADRIHAAHPAVKVVGPANARQDQAFLDELFRLGGLRYLDAVTFHPYEDEYNNGPEFLVPNLQAAHDSIRANNDGVDKPIWLTELGWSTSLVTEQQQANHLVRGEAIAFASNVERFYYYDLINDGDDPQNPFFNFGLFRKSSADVPAFEPKPAAMAQAVMIRKLAGKAFAERDALAETSYSYAFGEGEDTTRVAWATTPSSVSYATRKPVTVTDQYGTVSVLKPEGGQVNIALGEQAVYLDGDLGEASQVQ